MDKVEATFYSKTSLILQIHIGYVGMEIIFTMQFAVTLKWINMKGL